MLGLVINPNAGGAVKRASALTINYLQNNSIDYQVLSAKTPEQMQANLLKEKPVTVIIIGGDGTLQSVLKYAVDREAKLIVIPAGSGNDAARKLGLTSKKISEILDQGLKLEKYRAIDAVSVQTNLGNFVTIGTLSAGLDSFVNKKANQFKLGGFLKYPMALIRMLPGFSAVEYELIIEGKTEKFRGMLCSLTNSGIFGGGMKIVPEAKVDDSIFELFKVSKISKLELLTVFPRVYLGTHLSHPAVLVQRVESLQLKAEVEIYADGELLGFGGYQAELLSGVVTVAI